jgi:hypothetical protein
MIVFLTAPGHEYTVAQLAAGTYAAGLPVIRVIDYHRAFWARRLPRATYIFTDFERLAGWEQRAAAELFQELRAAGRRCLNDPACAMTRFELLRALHRTGVNPFNVHRADDHPLPARFPVFIRVEEAHRAPLTGLLATPAEMRAALTGLVADGWPSRLLLVVEFCAEPIAPNLWRKHGTMRIGDQVFFYANVSEDHWAVKYGKLGLATPAMWEQERAVIADARFTNILRPVFDTAGLEYGRADHGTVAGRQVIYEINSNPNLSRDKPHPSPIKQANLDHTARQTAAALAAIDSAAAGWLSRAPSPTLPIRERRLRRPVKRP